MMVLPKDIIQVGEANPNCKVYVEDYVVSFLKQQNRLAVDKEISMALYGKNKTEEGKTYVFVYGAAIIKSLQKETRHLSQAQNQEIEKLRKKYFAEYELMGYRILNGEMIEGMHICEKETFRYVSGYAQFYEKNDIMLAYMLEYKGENVQPEIVDSQKYEIVKKRQEERKKQGFSATVNNQPKETETQEGGITSRERDELKETWSGVLKKQRQGLRRLQYATVAVFALLCIVGVYTVNKPEDRTGQVEEKIPVAGPAENLTKEQENVSVLRTDEKLTEAVQEENRLPEESASKDEEGDKPDDSQDLQESPVNQEASTGWDEQESTENQEASDAQETPVNQSETAARETQETTSGQGNVQTEETTQADAPVKQPVEYVIQKGDTMLGISLRVYGNTTMVPVLCRENQISNPDDIKVGQKILLP